MEPQKIFQELEQGIGFGLPLSHEWQSISHLPLLILVGTTGVGKSTTTAALVSQGIPFTLLPNRRTLTDKIIIADQLKGKQKSIKSLNRIERFNYTRLYREQFPGGMAYVLSQLQIKREKTESLLVFDGLRGENEVRYAASNLTNAKFVILETSEWVRLQRLLHRQDVFDQITKFELESTKIMAQQLTSFADLGVPEAGKLISSTEEQQLLKLIDQGVFSATEVRDKLRILVEERHNYDPLATRITLQEIAPERTLVIDTTKTTPMEIAQQLKEWTEL